MVSISDYDGFHKMAKRHLLSNVLGANAQKWHRSHRDTMIGNISSRLHAQRRNVQGLGKDVEPIYVKELGTTLSKEEIYKTLVTDIMGGAIDVDWRDFFP
ncbi:hypothetical protein LWI29_027560 [Acer saccharum]|uniref:Uncharacterized protein n=1 Tax=Acer saccharum TaxID=4024 RepID=A0AA39VG19_ACESA|nr:hypothetical protein LWI29_027560 [Acer saccharum]